MKNSEQIADTIEYCLSMYVKDMIKWSDHDTYNFIGAVSRPTLLKKCSISTVDSILANWYNKRATISALKEMCIEQGCNRIPTRWQSGSVTNKATCCSKRFIPYRIVGDELANRRSPKYTIYYEPDVEALIHEYELRTNKPNEELIASAREYSAQWNEHFNNNKN